MTKKIALAGGAIAVAAIFAAGLALTAGAQVSSSTGPGVPPRLQPMVLQVGPNGRALMRGTVDAISSSTLTVKSWGGNWTVNVSASTKILPAASGNDLSNFKTGDSVGVQGIVSRSANWTIDATLVRDWTMREEVRHEQQENRREIRQLMKSEAPRNYQGTVSGLSGSSFTITEGTAALTVNVAAGAKALNRNWLSISLSNIQNGDAVRVWGLNASGTITASIVRDISIPRNQ